MHDVSSIIQNLMRDLGYIAPEIVLIGSIIAIIIIDFFMRHEASYSICIVALVGVFLSLHIILMQLYDPELYSIGFWGLLCIDKFTLFLKLFFIVATFFTIILTLESKQLVPYRMGEYHALLLIATLSMCFLVSARNFLLLFIALETMNIASYILASYTNNVRSSALSGLKYLVYGTAASAVMLFGISYLYGATGNLNVNSWIYAIRPAPPAGFLMLGLVFVGIGFKISAAPLHFCAPDTYQGAPSPISAYLSVAAKIAGFGVLIRILLPLFSNIAFFPESEVIELVVPYVFHFSLFFAIIAILTMTLGNLGALRQNNLKRLLAFSSIAQAGYILIGMTVLNAAAMSAMLFYAIVYLFMNIGAFYCAMVLENKTGSNDIRKYRGIFKEYPYLVIGLGVIFSSLAGIPPFGGFVGKYLLFSAVIEKALHNPLAPFYYTIAFFGIANCVLSLFYYVRIIKTMVFPHSDKTFGITTSPGEFVLIVLFVVVLFYLFIFWRQPYHIIEYLVSVIIM